MPLISVIMPTYKVEEYLPQCLESVMNQDFQDIEIIPVDDGSPDSCGAIIDKYASQDKRIHPIHQKMEDMEKLLMQEWLKLLESILLLLKRMIILNQICYRYCTG